MIRIETVGQQSLPLSFRDAMNRAEELLRVGVSITMQWAPIGKTTIIVSPLHCEWDDTDAAALDFGIVLANAGVVFTMKRIDKGWRGIIAEKDAEIERLQRKVKRLERKQKVLK